MKRFALAVVTLLTCMSLSAQWRFGNSPANNNAANDLEQNMQKLVMASVMINNFYVDSVDSKKLTEDAINGILSKLDPHSAYTNAADTKKFTEPLEGSFEVSAYSSTCWRTRCSSYSPCQRDQANASASWLATASSAWQIQP